MKRFLSKALLSVFLEKEARDRALGVPSTPVEPPADDPLPESLIRQPDAVADKRELRRLSKQASDALSRAQSDLDAPPSRKLAEAERKLSRGPIPITPDDTPPAPKGADRKALIAQAMAVQQKQAKKLDDLPPEDKLRLHLLARMALLGEDISKD